MSIPDSKTTSHPRTVVWILLADIFGESLKQLLRRAERMAGIAESQLCMKLWHGFCLKDLRYLVSGFCICLHLLPF